METNIRWIQRFKNYIKALSRLESAVNLSKQRDLSDLEQQGLIQAFEFTHELAWNTLKDFLSFQGSKDIYGSRDATRKAFSLEIIENGEIWMNMIVSRNKSTHTYNEETANDVVNDILSEYFEQFKRLETKLSAIKNREGN